MTTGLTAQGFVSESATETKAFLDGVFKNTFGLSLGSNSDGSIPAATFAGQLIAIIVDAVSAQWSGQLALYAGSDADQATDTLLDFLCSLTGTYRRGALFSTVVGVCVGTAGTPLPVGRVATVTTVGSRFDSIAPAATLAAVGTVWANSTGYAVYDLRTANGKAYICITPGVSAAMGGGPASTSLDITDGTVHWRYLGADTVGVALVTFEAEVSGPIGALAGQLATIGTPVAGWSSVINIADGTVGRARELDSALRVRRIQELAASGGGPPDSIRAAILKIADVINCIVFPNKGDVVDGNGVPAHGVEVLIQTLNGSAIATDAILGLAVFKAVVAGDAFGGNTSVSILDASGVTQVVRFTRPTPVLIYIVVTVYYDPTKWPASGAAAAVTAATKSALLTYGLGYQIGQDVRATPLSAAIFDGPSAVDSAGVAIVPAAATAAPMPGVVDTLVYIGTAPAPATAAPITIAIRQIAALDSTRISVTATPLSP